MLLVPEQNAATAPGAAPVGPRRRFRSLLAFHTPLLAEAFFCALLMTVLGIANSFFIQHLVDNVLAHNETRLLNALVQSPGIVAVVCGVLAGAISAAAAGALSIDQAWPWLIAALVFLLVAGALIAYWRASMAELDSAIRPLFPTPAGEVDAPF